MDRRTLLKRGVMLGGVATLAGLGLLLDDSDRDIDDIVLKYRASISEHVEGKDLIKVFDVPYFRDPSRILSEAILNVPVKKLEEQVTFDRPNDLELRTQAMIKPNHHLEHFMRQVDTDEHEKLFNEEGYGSIFYDFRILDIFKTLSMLQKSVKYITDYSNGDSERQLKNPYYDKREYWKFPEQTLIDGYGDCDDFSITVAGMLNSLWKNADEKGTVTDFGNPKAGLCILTDPNKSIGHAILAVSTNVSSIKGLMNNYLDSIGKETPSDALYPHIYVREGDFPRIHRSKCNACELDPNERIILLFEPQNYYSAAATISIEDYQDKKVILPGEKFVLGKDFVRARLGELTSGNYEEFFGPSIKLERF